MARIPFNRPYAVGPEYENIRRAVEQGHLAGNGESTKRCQKWLEEATGARKVMLTHSCTAALEMTAILANIEPGDEVIMPSYTFVSTANAFVLRGAVPVFVDIREDTLNLDENLIEAAITDRTKAICVVHYAGVACEMDTINAIAEKHGLLVIEDAAQGICARYKGRSLGNLGHLAAFSFHETKNLISGEGGALLVNDERFMERAEIIWEKGTNRSKFFRGEVDKYTWVDVGSSFLPSELVSAFLEVQLQNADAITQRRLEIWKQYRELLTPSIAEKRFRPPYIPGECTHNAHMFYVICNSTDEQSRLLDGLRERDVHAVFHYVPLHSSPGGKRFGRVFGSMRNTDEVSSRLVRLPLWAGMSDQQVREIAAAVNEICRSFK